MFKSKHGIKVQSRVREAYELSPSNTTACVWERKTTERERGRERGEGRGERGERREETVVFSVTRRSNSIIAGDTK